MEYVSPEKPWDEGDEDQTLWHSRINLAMLKELAAVLFEITQVDNDGWVLIGYRGSGSNQAVVLNQWGLTAFSVSRREVRLLAPTELAPQLASQYGGTVDKVGFPDGVVKRIRNLQPSSALELLTAHRSEIHDAHRQLQARPKTATLQRHAEHRPELLEALNNLSGYKIDQPDYFDDMQFDSTESHHWLIHDPSPPIIRDSELPSSESLRFIWPRPNVDLSTLPAERTAFINSLERDFGYELSQATRLYQFVHEMEIGDSVAIHAGSAYRRTACTGIVTSDYHYVPHDPDHPHQRSFRPETGKWPFWHSSSSNRISSVGPVSVTPEEWESLVIPTHKPEVDPVEEETMKVTSIRDSSASERDIVPLELITDHYASKGLHYSETQIADFYTALQTKGFVVLSGISGTGKSKIATGFTEMLPNALHTEIAGPDPVTAYQALRFKVSATETWAAISSDQSHLFPKTNASTRQEVNFVYEGASYRGSYKTRTLNFGKPTLYLILGKALAERLRSSAGEDLVYAQFRAAPHDRALPEIHITLDSPTVSQSSQAVETFTIPNTLFLSVRPDWRDSTSLLGYYNPLTKTYEWTDFLRFVLDAAENFRSENPIAWFVILDEMNLAHVEYYFADLLSVLESGREADPDHEHFGFTDQPLRLTYPEIVVNEAPPTEVRLPPNLYIIGTVNMDETTHAFSPKVLDRAFTMELTEVDFSDYPYATPVRADEALDDESKHEFLQVFSQNGAFPQIRKNEIREFVLENDDIRHSIQRLNSNLAKYRFHFGYRVFDEIMQFLANAEANEMYEDPFDALDSAAFMKILPKFSGSEARVGLPLAALIEWAKDPFAEGEEARPLERTRDRAKYMQNVLRTDGFVTAF